MNESVEKKLSGNSMDYLGAVNSLLETINDKDEGVRNCVEKSLVRMSKRRPNETIEIICNYRQKTTKLPDVQVSILLRVIESFVRENSDQLGENCLDKIIDFCVTEMVKATEHTPLIQNPCVDILVATGRVHCTKVIEGLLKNLQSNQIGHFMVLHCIGSLATANISGIFPFVRQTLEIIIPTLNSIRMDHIKQAYSFAIGRIAEAIGENLANDSQLSSNNEEKSSYENELGTAYNVLMNQWLPHRDQKVCIEILQALSFVYPLLPKEKLIEQVPKVIPQLQGFYRRSMDRNAITQLLASVLKVSIDVEKNCLDTHADSLISNLFDLVCVIPDYVRPQTAKGHYEVLRCFDLLLPIYSEKVLDMLLVQLRSNSERERIKALLVVTHVTNVKSDVVGKRIDTITEVLKHMMKNERTIKLKLVLLKTIVVLAQKGLLQDNEFIRYIIMHCCQLSKVNLDYGTADEYVDFCQACKNSLDLLASTVSTVADLLKRELLQFYMLLDYTDVCGTLAMCMAKLFEKSSDLSFSNVIDAEKTLTFLPSPESVVARSLILIGNSNQSKRTEHILEFLKFYAKIVNRLLSPLWTAEIPKLKKQIKEPDFHEKIFKFVVDTIKEYDDPAFPETFVNKLADQMVLYPITVVSKDYFVSALHEERGMLLKLIGTTLCYVTDNQTIEAKLELIINAARQEKLEKLQAHAEFETKLTDACTAIGYISKIHLSAVLQKLEQLIEDGSRKQTTGFFSFMKDNTKETEMYKVNLLAVEAYGKIIENIAVYEELKDVNEKIVNFLIKQLSEAKDITMKKKVLNTLLILCQTILDHKELCEDFKCRPTILAQLVKIDANHENLPLYPNILKLSAILVQINTTDDFEVHVYVEESCRTFFTAAQQLKNKFDSVEEDDRNSYIAKYLNLALPELNHLIKVIFEQNPSPATLDDVNCVLEFWIRNRNSEVRICAAHVMDNALTEFMQTVKIGCEAPAKFNQTGSMLGKIVPRCIDTYATVRQTAVDILKKILEISCIYETLTIADKNDSWYKELDDIRENIGTDDAKQLYQITEDISRIIATRLSNFQYMQFCKTILNALEDSEQSSAIGSAVVLKNFIRLKGADLFHVVPELVQESLTAVAQCEIPRAKTGVLKALVALAKHHPKLVCTEMLEADLPLQKNIVEFWQCVSGDGELSGYMIDHLLGLISSSCLFEAAAENSNHQNIAAHQPFAIFCALKEIVAGKDIKSELLSRFPELFALFLASIATYTNLAPPASKQKSSPSPKSAATTNNKSKFGFIPNKELTKMNPCQVIIEAFQAYLENVEMEQLLQVLSVCPHLASSSDLSKFMELLTPMAGALVGQIGLTSPTMTRTLNAVSKYISSPYDHQRIAAVGLYSQLVPLKPSGDLSAIIMQHLNSALGDPNALVRGFCIRGMAYVGNLSDYDVDKYSEMSLSALLKGIDESSSNSFINIPLESMKGLSRIVMSLHKDKLETFQVSLAIRIRPFFENQAVEIREAAVLLFGDLCRIKTSDYGTRCKDPIETMTPVSDALREQIFVNYFSLFLHLSETDAQIVRAAKTTLRKISNLINAPKVNDMVQSHILEHGNLQLDNFLPTFLKTINEHLSEHIPDFIESCLPYLKSSWAEIRGTAACIIGILYNLHSGSGHQQHSAEYLSHKISVLLHDDQIAVRMKAANALGFMFSNVI